MPEKTILQRLKDLTDKTAEKINALNTKIGEFSPFKGLSPNAGNSLSLDEDEKLFYKERTPQEIAQAYEGLDNTNKFSDSHKQTVEGFASIQVDFDLDETAKQGSETGVVITTGGYKKTGKTEEDIPTLGGGDFKKSIIDSKVSTVDTIEDLKDLDRLPSQTSVNVKGYYSPNDGGGGIFSWIDGNTDDEDGGFVIESNEDASGRWVRIHIGDLDIRIFGASSDLADNTPFIQATIDYSFDKSLNYRANEVSDQLWMELQAIVIPQGVFKIQSTILLKAGQKLVFRSGVIRANANMRYMMWSSLQASDYMAGAFSNRLINFEGEGIFDGNGLATYAYYGNTLNKCAFNGKIVTQGCTYKSFSNKEITAISDRSITVTDVNDVMLGDIVKVYDIPNDRYIEGGYNITEINSNTVSFSATIVEVDGLDFSTGNYELVNIPTGWVLNGNQNRYSDLIATRNTCGFFFGASRGTTAPGQNDDNFHFSLFSDRNDFGGIYCKYDYGVAMKCTLQHNRITNVTTVNSSFDHINCYWEASDNFISLNSEKYALNYINSPRCNLRINIPINSAIGWFRPLLVGGQGINIELRGSSFGNQTENPNSSGDIAVVKTLGDKTQINLELTGYRNLQSIDGISKSMIDELGNFPPRCTVSGADINDNNKVYKRGEENHVDSTLSYIYSGDNYPRIGINSLGELEVSDGSASNVAKLKRYGDRELGVDFNTWRAVDFSSKQPDGSYTYIFADSKGQIRTHNSKVDAANKDSTGILLRTIKPIKTVSSDSNYTLVDGDQYVFLLFTGDLPSITIPNSIFKKTDIIDGAFLSADVQVINGSGLTLNYPSTDIISQKGSFSLKFTAVSTAYLTGDFKPEESIVSSGTFTPTLSVTGGATITATLSYATYSKIGDVFTFTIKFTNIDTSVSVSNEVFTVGPLPFSAANDTLADYFITDASGGNGGMHCAIIDNEIKIDYVSFTYDGDGTSASELIVSGSFIATP